MKIVKPSAELLWITPKAEEMIERAARTCYKSEEKITKDSNSILITKLVKCGHHAMLEHASASIKFVCDRGISHELVRHRLCAFAQESTRYCNYGKEKFGNEITVIRPPRFEDWYEEAWIDLCERIEQVYMDMVRSGCPPQTARSILPTCLKTEIVCTANLREWRHIFTLRLAKAAHVQIREIMILAFGILGQECPTVFEDLKYLVEE